MQKIFGVILLGVLLSSFSTRINQLTQYFVQVKVHTVSTEMEAQEIDRKMEKKSGVSSSNTDHVTSTFFCLLEPGQDFGEEDFINWFSRLGYNISCFHKGVHGVDAVLSPHDLKSCVEENN